jgi:hypothetical protein
VTTRTPERVGDGRALLAESLERRLDDGDDPASDVPPGVPDPDGPLVTCCAKGISSLYVAEFLAQQGWDVVGLDDGMYGWARLYESTPVQVSAHATLDQYHRPSSGCLGYLIVSGDEAAVVDPLDAFTDKVATGKRQNTSGEGCSGRDSNPGHCLERAI